MATRAEELAARFEAANQDVIDCVLGANGNLSATCPAEGWSAAALGAHIGGGHQGIVDGLVKPIVEGREIPPFEMSAFDEGNKHEAAQNVAMPQDEILTLLREHGDMAAAYLRSLSDEDLDRATMIPVMGPNPVTAQQMIEMVLIGHPVEHGQSLRQGLG